MHFGDGFGTVITAGVFVVIVAVLVLIAWLIGRR